MAKHGGGDGGTMKDPGNHGGNKGSETRPLPKADKPKEPIKDDIIKPEEK